MPREQMDSLQVAAYLHMDIRELKKLASRDKIPCRRVGDDYQFRKGEVDHWVEVQMHKLGKDRLEDIVKGVSQHHGFDHEAMLVNPMIPDDGVVVPLQARTREAVLRTLVDEGQKRQLVLAKDEVLEEVRRREELCTTAMVPGVALPHPHHPLPWDISQAFIIVGLTPSGIPYGAEDGSLTRLFFFICCKDERTHLHVLARLGRMLHEKGAIDDLLGAEDADELASLIYALEEDVL